MRTLATRDPLTLCFAHPAYRLQDRFESRQTGIRSFQVHDLGQLQERIGEADVLCVSGLWRNELIERAPRLAFVQSISAGTDQYDRAAFAAAGIRLASAQGANERAVSQHAMALILALARHLPQARDNQSARRWRGMISEIAQREDELGGQTLVIVGMGRIGSHLARLARAFEMRVVAVKRDTSRGVEAADEAIPQSRLAEALARADYVALTCPLTPETTGLIDAAALASMKPSARLINVARGRVVVETDLIDALERGVIAGAALDTTCEEPLKPESPLWTAANVFITPHAAGETRRYEDNVIDLLLENLDRLRAGDGELRNPVV
jgi:D-2-hydroxyacid dehydrogenase (NADP+)